jgi:hypothetical protein
MLLLLTLAGFGMAMHHYQTGPRQTWKQLISHLDSFSKGKPDKKSAPEPAVAREPSPEPLATETPSPIPVPEPEPVVVESTIPTPDTEEPTKPDAPDAVAFLTSNPKALPNVVTLQSATEFEVLVNGLKKGTIEGTPGTRVKVLDIKTGLLQVALSDASKWIPVNDTDLATLAPDAMDAYIKRNPSTTRGIGATHVRQPGTMRRVTSPDQPMWVVHIDTWNYPDPQKLIDLIPQDIRPYVVIGISLSISRDKNGRFNVIEYGYETAKSWLRTCAENRMWAMVQPASGGYCHFSDVDRTVHEEFYRDYPNFVGFNYCEQFWGFDVKDDRNSPKWTDRVANFAELLKMGHRYGGYLVVSWCANEWSPEINPIAMLRRSPDFAEASRRYTQNYILCEKYTQISYQYDMESLCLGAYLSGYSGNYGLRYDSSGWTDANGEHRNFTPASGIAPHLERIMLSGATVYDGPELIWQQCFREINRTTADDGFTQRNWEMYPQFKNISIDLFRKILDGTMRIPSRQEVIDRTKVIVVNDVTTGNRDDLYSTPVTLFEGLFRMDGDGNLKNNRTFFKKTGRYPTIPIAHSLNDAPAKSFDIQVLKSEYANRWPTIEAKQQEFDSLFPLKSTGDLFAGRHENGWVIYNPYKTSSNTTTTASGSIPFVYNTCDRIEVTLSQYAAGVVKEHPDKLEIYLNNFDNALGFGMQTDTITIYGSTSQPVFTYVDRGEQEASVVSSNWANGVFTLTVKHNGPVDISIACAGNATERLTSVTPSTVNPPPLPPVYWGPRQYEAECFDFKDVKECVPNAARGDIRGYTGQGYLIFGTNTTASVRDVVNVPRSGVYRLETRYLATNATVNTIDLFINGAKVITPTFTATRNGWALNKQQLSLSAGTNTLEFRANDNAKGNILFDNIVVIP